MENKVINRSGQDANKIFDSRTLTKDYRTLVPLLKKGMRILDIGCGTGSITKDIALLIGDGKITGIDNTENFIVSGKAQYGSVVNLDLIHTDFFSYEPFETFDLIIAARTLQWMSRVDEALVKIHSLLKPGGMISVLDYNHEQIEWQPSPPESMRIFYNTFLKWRKDAGMNNAIANHLPTLLERAGFNQVESINADEYYHKDDQHFRAAAGIWSKVAGSRQMVEEGYIDDQLRLKAISDYDAWLGTDALSMTMKLNDVRGQK